VATTATVTLTMSAPATSKAFTPVAPATGNTEAALFVYAAAAPPAPPAVPGTGAASGPYYGTISTTSPMSSASLESSCPQVHSRSVFPTFA
jgi:hypothetical protein